MKSCFDSSGFVPRHSHDNGETHAFVRVTANDGANGGGAAGLNRGGYCELLNSRVQEEPPARYCVGILIKQGQTVHTAVARHLPSTPRSDAQDERLTRDDLNNRRDSAVLPVAAVMIG